MKKFLSISYWALSVLVVSAIVVSIGYRVGEAFFIGTMFLPGALVAKYGYSWLRKKASSGYRRGLLVRDALYIGTGIVILEVLLFMLAHYFILLMRSGVEDYYNWPTLPRMLLNPVFIALIIAALATGGVVLGRYLEFRFPSRPRGISFLSERRTVTLLPSEIIYVESNDDVTVVHAESGECYRNKTSISQWERILEDGFVRVHRSYIVRVSAISSVDKDFIMVGDLELPVSRKYKAVVSGLKK